MAAALAVRTRSGLVETLHDGVFAAADLDGDLIAHTGDLERPFFLRSSAKPFQAVIAQENGADLDLLQLALASASHDGDPVHVSLIAGMLHEFELGESDLKCPPDWPLGTRARARALASGEGKRRITHNCSGKHAAWLRACVARGWPTETYLEPSHPLQTQIVELVAELGGFAVEPVGVDGCGAPVLRTNGRAMAVMFARLASDERLREVYRAMHTYPALVSGTGNGDASIATTFDAAAKRGAAGCIGVAVRDQLGLAVKSWDGREDVASAAAIAGLSQIARPSAYQDRALSALVRPEIRGGDEVVGHLEPMLELEWA